ncbi:MAG: preprotein translocase subunit SecA [Betaproteobacteria bacterium]|nr:preprotein translocase subunit SecA [Betaproteobacteria bacterium]
MIERFLKKIFGSRNDRLVKQYGRTVRKVNDLEPQMQSLDDATLQAKTSEFRQRVAGGEALDAILPEAFAVVREASRRVMGMRHFDVQLVGGMVLHDGRIAEMRTGEGKTLTGTLAVYLNALTGKGVHVVTVNDYLAARDAEWMGKLYNWLGMSTGVIVSQQDAATKQAAYAADITYGTNNEFGFDYLRDNMEYSPEGRRQRGLAFAIVDEVDSILIDEARTPLIISGAADGNTELYVRINTLIPGLAKQEKEDGEGDYSVDEKQHQVLLTEAGHEKVEQLLTGAGLLPQGASLYDPHHISLVHHFYAALKAHALYHRDQHYVVQDGEVIIVDEFTGRLMAGRRWSEGLHQAVEAKEGVAIQRENQTLASITFQNYFRMYGKLAGMTGTADTEAYEFQQIYGLETVIIPTHRQMVRKDGLDHVYQTAAAKHRAVIRDIRDCHERGQPVLVGTTSIENNELLSAMLKEVGLPHQVLNAKQHDSEAQVIAEAGRPGVITIATNMAGRGTDIVLGGNPKSEIAAIENNETLSDADKRERIAAIDADWQKRHDAVLAAGGLHIIGTERHESRRIDNQLRGRAGRQGDPGSSRFYLSLEDPLLRIFAAERVSAIMTRLSIPEDEAIEHPWVTRSIENAQRKVESRNFDIRKHLLEFDDVANDQRRVIYQQRNEIMEAAALGEMVAGLRLSVIENVVSQYMPEGSVEEQWDLSALEAAIGQQFALAVPVLAWMQAEPDLDNKGLVERIAQAAAADYAEKIAPVDPQSITDFERSVMLQTIDGRWREHLAALDYLRQGIHLRGYAQQNPKQEYKREAFQLFSDLLDSIKSEVTQTLMLFRVRPAEEVAPPPPPLQPLEVSGTNVDEAGLPRVGRNDPCPCGSGKKYKACHGKLS